jgi:hypothetical protein
MKFLNKIMLYEKEERTKTIWAVVLLAAGILILYFNPLSIEEGWGFAGVLLLFISGYLIGSMPNSPQHPKDHFNFDNK